MRENREGMPRFNRRRAFDSHIQQRFTAFEVEVDTVNTFACLNWEKLHEELRKEEKVSAAVFSPSPVIERLLLFLNEASKI